HLWQGPAQRSVEPAIDDVDREPALFAFENARIEETPADLAVEPFARAASNLEAGLQPLCVLDDGPIEVWHADFQAVSHRKLVGEHQQFVGKRGTDLQQLESAEL